MPEEVVEDNFKISTRRRDPDIVLVTIAGDLDIGTVAQARAFLTHAIALPPRHLILDLSGVKFLSSSGLALLIAAQSDDGTTRALTPDLGHAESGHGRGSEMIHDHGP